MHADVCAAIEDGTRHDCVRRHLGQFAPKLFLDAYDVFFQSPGVEHVLEPSLVAIGAVAMLDVDAHDRIGDPGGLLRLDDHPSIAGEVLVTRDATERETEPHALLRAEARLQAYRLKS